MFEHFKWECSFESFRQM